MKVGKKSNMYHINLKPKTFDHPLGKTEKLMIPNNSYALLVPKVYAFDNKRMYSTYSKNTRNSYDPLKKARLKQSTSQ